MNVSSLLIRSKLESTQRRAVERSMTQLQELVDCLSKASPAPHRRLEYFYVSRMPSEWELEGSLADVFVSLGAVSSALDLYLRLQMWEKVIGCYQHLELRHRVSPIHWSNFISGCVDRVSHFRQRRLLDRSWPKRRHQNCGACWATVLMTSSATRKPGRCPTTPAPEHNVIGPISFTGRSSIENVSLTSKSPWL